MEADVSRLNTLGLWGNGSGKKDVLPLEQVSFAQEVPAIQKHESSQIVSREARILLVQAIVLLKSSVLFHFFIAAVFISERLL